MKALIETVEVKHHTRDAEYFELLGGEKTVTETTKTWESEPDGPFDFLTIDRGQVTVSPNKRRTQTIFIGEMDGKNFLVTSTITVSGGYDRPILRLGSPKSAFLGLRQQIGSGVYEAEIIKFEADVPINRV
jgi:hypothetical protein